VIDVNIITHDFGKFLLNAQYVRPHPDFINVNYAFRKRTGNLCRSNHFVCDTQFEHSIQWCDLFYINDVNNSGKRSV